MNSIAHLSISCDSSRMTSDSRLPWGCAHLPLEMVRTLIVTSVDDIANHLAQDAPRRRRIVINLTDRVTRYDTFRLPIPYDAEDQEDPSRSLKMDTFFGDGHDESDPRTRFWLELYRLNENPGVDETIIVCCADGRNVSCAVAAIVHLACSGETTYTPSVVCTDVNGNKLQYIYDMVMRCAAEPAVG